MAIDEPFEYLSFGGTFSRTFAIFFDRLDVFLSIAAAVLVPFIAFIITFVLWIVSVLFREEENPNFHVKHLPMMLMMLTFQAFMFVMFSIVGRAAISKAVAQLYVGQAPNTMVCLKDAWANKATLIISTCMVVIPLTVGILPPVLSLGLAVGSTNFFTVLLCVLVCTAYIVGAVFTWYRTRLMVPAIMIETFPTPLAAVQRSWDLSLGSWCYIFCTIFSMTFLNNLVSRVLHNIFVTGDVMDIMFSLTGILVNLVPMVVFFPLITILETVIYLNLRIGRESMNHQVLTGDLMKDGQQLADRFRNDDPNMSGGGPSMDYRHVPLMDAEDASAPLAVAQPQVGMV